MKTHKNLNVWRDSISLIKELYSITNKFPVQEQYGMVSQIRRAAVSVATNISEGAARNSSRDYIRFLRIASGSLSEVETLLIIATSLEMLSIEKFDELIDLLGKTGSQLTGLIRSLERKIT